MTTCDDTNMYRTNSQMQISIQLIVDTLKVRALCVWICGYHNF